MTKEQAIKELTELLPEEFLMEYSEAIRMAIKVLEQEQYDTIVRDIAGYEGKYTVDIFGNVKNSKGEVLKKRENEFGYYDIGLYKNNKQSRYKVHRLVAKAFIPNPQNKEQVNHIDGNKHNNCVWNLEWVTAKENTHHAIVTELRKDTLRDLRGQKFGSLTVIRYVGTKRYSKGHVRNIWECQCDCGRIHLVTDNNLVSGRTKSCGCMKGARKWIKK